MSHTVYTDKDIEFLRPEAMEGLKEASISSLRALARISDAWQRVEDCQESNGEYYYEELKETLLECQDDIIELALLAFEPEGYIFELEEELNT